MASGARFQELLTWARTNALDAALDTPVNEMAPFIGLEPKHAALLAAAARTFEATSVGELLASSAGKALKQQWPAAWPKIARRLERWLVMAKNDRDVAAMADARLGPLPSRAGAGSTKDGHTRPGSPIVLTLSVEPPADAALVADWAEASGVAHRLREPVQVLARYTGMTMALAGLVHRRATVGELFKPSASSSSKYVSRADLEGLRRIARAHLRDGAANLRAAEQRQLRVKLNAVEPTHPAVVAFVEQLGRARAKCAAYAAQPPPGARFVDEARFVERPPKLVYTERLTSRAHEPSVTLELPLATAPLAASLRQLERSMDPDAAWALAAFLDVVRDPEAPAHAALIEWLSAPPWARALNAIDAAIPRVDAATPAQRAPRARQRLAWRVRWVDGPVIDPLLQQERDEGRYTTGAGTTSELATGLLASGKLIAEPGDALALAVLAQGGGFTPWRAAESHWRATRALEQLIDHPRVVVGSRGGVPARIAREPVVLTFKGNDDAPAHPVFRLGSEAMSATEILERSHGAPEFVLVDEATGNVVLSRLDEASLALVRALSELDELDAGFPIEAQRELVRRLHEAAPALQLDVPEALMGRPVAAPPEPVVRLTPLEGLGLELALVTRPLPGATMEPGAGSAKVMGTLDGEAVVALREHEAERARAGELALALGLDLAQALGGYRYRLTDPEAALDVLERLEARAGELGVEWPDGAKRVRVEGTASTSKLHVRVRSARDWFGLDGEVEVAGATVALGALLEAVRRGARFVALGPRRFARIADELRDKLMATADVVHHAKSKVEFTLAALPTIDALLEGTGDADLTRRFVELRRRLHQAAQHEPALPKGLKAELRAYQAEGVRWLLRLRAWGAGACLADDMGLGKTLQALALLVDSASEGPSLVVAPTSVVGNWLIEAARFAPSLRVKLLRGVGRHALLESASPGDVFVTSYDVMVRDEAQLAATCFANVIFDEAQALKNPVTRRAKAARAIDAAFRVALTGTPIENHLGDLWSLYRVVVPGLLGSAEQFRDRFAAPIERGLNAAERKAALARVVRPFLLRRTKAQVAPELPPRIEVLREIELSAAERALYEGARLAALATLTGSAEGTDQRFAVLAAMTRLRRLACHPRLVDDGSTVASSKLATFLELARELRDAGQKALVFSQFTSHLALARQALAREGFTYLELDGSTPAEQRQARVAEFQAGKAELFLISLKAGGSGLNLTAAEVVIHLDPWWNPAAEDQATDRAHRIGQARAVTVVRLVARGTIEQAVLALHGTKRALAQSLLEGADVTAKLSSAELLALFQGSNEVASAEIEVESEVE